VPPPFHQAVHHLVSPLVCAFWLSDNHQWLTQAVLRALELLLELVDHPVEFPRDLRDRERVGVRPDTPELRAHLVQSVEDLPQARLDSPPALTAQEPV